MTLQFTKPASLETEALRRKLRTRVLPLPAWTSTRRRFLSPEREFDLTTHFYLAGLYNCTAKRMVVYKASQMGASEYGISYVLWSMDLRHASALYVFPTATDVSDFSSARLSPAIEASPHLTSQVRSGNAKGGADRVRLKRIGDQHLYFRGAKVDANNDAPQLKSIPVDILVLDEVDSMDPRAHEIARKRLGHSDLAEERDFSTPTFPNLGIHAMFKKSDQREWFVRCTHCGRWQYMTIDHVVREWDDLKRPVSWWGQDDGTAWVACRKCKRPLDRLARGEWVAAIPGCDVAGFHLTKLFSPYASILEIVQGLQTVNEDDRQQVYNQDLGLPYVPRGGGLTREDLLKVMRDYASGPLVVRPRADSTRTRVLESIAGVDVGRVLHVVIREAKVGLGLKRRQLFAGTVINFEDLNPLFERFNVKAAVIDALPETKKARDFQKTYPNVYLCYYSGNQAGLKNDEPVQLNQEEGIVNVDRTRTIDTMVGAFLDGDWTLPVNARSVPLYFQQMQASVRILKTRPSGEQVATWVSSAPDHYFHAENYCGIATFIPLPTKFPRQGQLHTESSEWE